MLNRRQSAAARQLLLTTYLLSAGGRAKDEEGLSQRAIAARLEISKTTVNDILRRREKTTGTHDESTGAEERAVGPIIGRAGGA